MNDNSIPKGFKNNPTIKDLYGHASGSGINLDENIKGSEVSNKLKEIGIPGIKYLDQGSRGTEKGTYNYVVFDDKIPHILERNGQKINNLAQYLFPTLTSLGLYNMYKPQGQNYDQ